MRYSTLKLVVRTSFQETIFTLLGEPVQYYTEYCRAQKKIFSLNMQILNMDLYSALADESNKPKFAEFRWKNEGLQWYNSSSLGLKLPIIWMHKYFCRRTSGWRVLHKEKVYRVAIPTVLHTFISWETRSGNNFEKIVWFIHTW